MKKINKIFALFLVIFALFLCVGCKNDNGDEPPYTPPYTPPVIQEHGDIDDFKFKYGQSTLKRAPNWFEPPCYFEFYVEITNILDTSNFLYANNFKFKLIKSDGTYNFSIGCNIETNGTTVKEFSTKQKISVKIITDRFSDSVHDEILNNRLKIYYKTFQIASLTFN